MTFRDNSGVYYQFIYLSWGTTQYLYIFREYRSYETENHAFKKMCKIAKYKNDNDFNEHNKQCLSYKQNALEGYLYLLYTLYKMIHQVDMLNLFFL